jgi:hypothetical protein
MQANSSEGLRISRAEIEMMCPRFIVKLITKKSSYVEVKTYYNVNSLMADVIHMWTSHDMVIQPFIRQRHVTKPSVIQYHMKSNSGVYKASSLVNNFILDRSTHFYKQVISILESQYKTNI